MHSHAIFTLSDQGILASAITGEAWTKKADGSLELLRKKKADHKERPAAPRRTTTPTCDVRRGEQLSRARGEGDGTGARAPARLLLLLLHGYDVLVGGWQRHTPMAVGRRHVRAPIGRARKPESGREEDRAHRLRMSQLLDERWRGVSRRRGGRFD